PRRVRSVTPVTSDALAEVLPDYVFVSVIFHQFPLAYTPPAPLKPSVLFAVPRGKDDAPRLLTSPKGLEAFFKQAGAPVRDPARPTAPDRAAPCVLRAHELTAGHCPSTSLKRSASPLHR